MPSAFPASAVPYLLPYATFRLEPFGGLLFNPYLPGEARLDDAEAGAIRLCDGQRTCGEIRAQASGGDRVVERAFRKAQGIVVLDFADGPVEGCLAPPVATLMSPSNTLSAPKRVAWEVTYRCNLHCPHCISDSGGRKPGELDTGQALELIEAMADAKVMYLLLSGGEPFLREDLLTLLEGIATTNMRMDIVTNGFHLPEPFMTELPQLPLFSTQVSLDGIGATHDRFRGMAGSFDAACRTIRRLREAGLAVGVSHTATRENLSDLDALIDLAVTLDCQEFKVTPFRPTGRGGLHNSRLSLGTEGHYRLSRRLAERKKELGDRININMGSCFPFLLEGDVPAFDGDVPMGCSAGADTLCIGADGTAYPCAFFRTHPLGNALKDGILPVWRDSPVLQSLRNLKKRDMREPCASCDRAPLQCGGGCRAAAFASSGDLRAVDPGCYRTLVTRR
jgi:radical SAM protein with 4Fe4S-binding SPASM domain